MFTVRHGQMSSVWVNTRYDPTAGRMQYVHIVADAKVCVIDVIVTSVDSMHILVEVSYRRTARDPGHNEDIVHLSQKDAQNGPEWRCYVENALGIDNF